MRKNELKKLLTSILLVIIVVLAIGLFSNNESEVEGIKLDDEQISDEYYLKWSEKYLVESPMDNTTLLVNSSDQDIITTTSEAIGYGMYVTVSSAKKN